MVQQSSLIFIFFRTHVLGFSWVALVSWIRTGELDNGYVFENLSHSSRRPNFMVVDKNTAISDIEVSLSLTCYIFFCLFPVTMKPIEGHPQELHSKR